MAETAQKPIVDVLADYDQLEPVSCEYAGPGSVLVTLKTKTGAPVSYTMTTAMLLRSMTMAMDLINSSKVAVLRDVGVFLT